MRPLPVELSISGRGRHSPQVMKIIHTLLMAAISLALLPGCREKTLPEKVGDKVDDALDRRPAEKVRDAGEDARDEAKDAARKVKRDLE